jgi:hypothetical protein
MVDTLPVKTVSYLQRRPDQFNLSLSSSAQTEGMLWDPEAVADDYVLGVSPATSCIWTPESKTAGGHDFPM